MLRIGRLLVALYCLVLLQTTFVPSVQILGIRPDLLLILVVLAAFHEGAAGGALVGFVAGLFVDLNSSGLLGFTSLANSLLAFGVGSIADRLVRGSPSTRLVVVFLAALGRDLLLALMTLHTETGKILLRSAAPEALYTALLAVPLMALLDRTVWREVLHGGRGRSHGHH